MFGNLVQTHHAGTYKGIQKEKISSQKIHKAKKDVLNENAFLSFSLSHTHKQYLIVSSSGSSCGGT